MGCKELMETDLTQNVEINEVRDNTITHKRWNQWTTRKHYY